MQRIQAAGWPRRDLILMEMLPSKHATAADNLAKSRPSKSCHLWIIDVKSFLAGMLLVGSLLVLQQSLGHLRSSHLHSITYLDFNHNLISPVMSTTTASVEGEAGCKDSTTHNGSTQLLARQSGIDEHKHSEKEDNLITDLDDDGDAEDAMVTKKQSFHAFGRALALFVHMASYRGGPDSFAIIGLGAKPAHVYGEAGFECEWISTGNPHVPSSKPIKGATRKFLPDWNMGRQYTVVVVNCSFEEPVGIDREGGELVVYALYGEGSGIPDTTPERIVALTEKKNEYDAKKFSPPYPYDYVYCGSPLYGKLNAQRVREWMAYHVKIFGKRAHFFLYDAGGVTQSVARALQPWRRRGYVTVHDIREQEKYDGYYHNQFLVVNDCLHRTRFLPKWTFFFDVDEFLWLPSNESLGQVMQDFSNYTQIIFRQKPMAAQLCQAQHQGNISRKWGFEKLVYRNINAGITWDRKYAIQPRSAFTTGVHRSDHIVGNDIVQESLGYFPQSLVPKLWYYHFHSTITQVDELCRMFVPSNIEEPTNASSVALALEPVDYYDTDGTPFRLDTSLQELAQSVKDFELEQIGIQPTILD